MDIRELKQLVEPFELSIAQKDEFEQCFNEISTHLKQKGQTLKQWEEFAIFDEYRKVVQQAESILANIKKIIRKAEAENALETDPVNFSPEDIEVFYKLNIYFDLAMWNLRKIYIATHQTQSILLEAEDFPSSPPVSLTMLCRIMSGPWDLNNINALVKDEKHDSLDANGINSGFYTDYQDNYFNGQHRLLRGRQKSSNAHLDVKEFVSSFLKANHLPETIRPNLNGLISTLAYQSGIKGTLSIEACKHIRLSTDKEAFEAGKKWVFLTYFDFDDKGKIKISFLSKTKTESSLKLLSSSGSGVEYPGPDMYLQGELTIQVSLDNLSNPIFTLESFKKNLFLYLDEEQSKQYHWIIDQNWLKPKNWLNYKNPSIWGGLSLLTIGIGWLAESLLAFNQTICSMIVATTLVALPVFILATIVSTLAYRSRLSASGYSFQKSPAISHKLVWGAGIFLSLAFLCGVVIALAAGNIPSEFFEFITHFLETGIQTLGINTLTDVFAIGSSLKEFITVGLILAVPILLTLITTERLFTAYSDANETETLPQNRFQLFEREALKSRNLITELSDTHNFPAPLFTQAALITGDQFVNTANQNPASPTGSHKSS